MKRDLNLIRDILIEIEKRPDAGMYAEEVVIEGVDEETVSFHVMLLDQAGLIVGEEAAGTEDILYWNAKHLTNAGYDFLASIKNDSVWSVVRASALKLGNQITLGVVSDIAKLAFKSYAASIIPGLDAA